MVPLIACQSCPELNRGDRLDEIAGPDRDRDGGGDPTDLARRPPDGGGTVNPGEECDDGNASPRDSRDQGCWANRAARRMK